MFKFFSNESEWDIFKSVIYSCEAIYTKSKKEQKLADKICNSIWNDNTDTRPDFITNDMMIEMFEVDDIVAKKKGRENPQRKADARALREVERLIQQFPEGTFADDLKIIAHGDTRYNPKSDNFIPDDSVSHHNYRAYLSNFQRICQKHLNSVEAYRKNYPNKKLGFLIVDDSTFYITRKQFQTNPISTKEAFLDYPFFDKNFMNLFITSKVDFVMWAFNNKYFYTSEFPHGEASPFPTIALISKDNYYTRYSKYFDVNSMVSLEE
ncbi:hypothetical protein ABZ559_12145 [Streptococcus sp. ZY19097]|uniref:hypothetical protein n=1 Tax=Streptococcus sp. ZY19097 TaxID=3231906 RepID=UPI00345B158B